MTVLLCLFNLSECVVLFGCLIAMVSAGRKSLIVVWWMRVTSTLARSSVCQMTPLCEEVLDKVLLHRSCLVRKLCQPSAYGCNPDKVQHRHHALCGFTSHLKPRQCSCCCTCCRALAVVLLLLYSCCFALREDVMMYGQKAFRMWAL